MAASEVSLLSQELNKLTKQVLIEIIMYKKVPTNVKVSDTLQKLINTKETSREMVNNEFSEEFFDTMSKLNEDKHSQSEMDTASFKREFSTLKQLIFHLEKRTNEQEQLILLLKNKNNCSINDKAVPPVGRQYNGQLTSKENCNGKNIQTSLLKTSHVDSHKKEPLVTDRVEQKNSDKKQPKKQEKTSTDIGDSSQQQKITLAQVNEGIKRAEKMTELKEVSDRRQHGKNNYYRKPIIGTNNTNKVKTIPKKGYLHLYRCDAGTTAKDILDCLKQTAPHIPFGCETLTQNALTASFKVDFPIQHYKEVYEPNIWPDGAAVRRFTFRKRNFQQEASERSANL